MSEFKFLLECAPERPYLFMLPSNSEWDYLFSHISPILAIISSSVFANLMSKKAILIFYRFVFLWLLVNLNMLPYIYWSCVVLLRMAYLYYLPISVLDCCLFLTDLKACIITFWYEFFLCYICYRYFSKPIACVFVLFCFFACLYLHCLTSHKTFSYVVKLANLFLLWLLRFVLLSMPSLLSEDFIYIVFFFSILSQFCHPS